MKIQANYGEFESQIRHLDVYDKSSYTDLVSAISVRLDEEALRALAQLEATGLSRSEAIRQALTETAKRRHRAKFLAREVAELQKDQEDQKEMAQVAAMMESLRAPG